MFIATLNRFILTSLVYKDRNNGDKLCHRKSMRAADEKLIINKLVHFFSSWSQVFVQRRKSRLWSVECWFYLALNKLINIHGFFNINVYYGAIKKPNVPQSRCSVNFRAFN